MDKEQVSGGHGSGMEWTDLGMSVFASLAGAHLHDLAWPAFNHNVAVLAKG